MAKYPFQQLDVIWKASQRGNMITDCYRLMYNKELWMKAYGELYPNGGSLPKGASDETIDGFGLQIIDDIIEQLKAGTFRFTPVERDYIRNSSGEKRPLEVPNVKDQLVQEVMRMIIDHIYEPVFSANSHGTREGRSCHTALSQVKNTWQGLTWCIKGDMKGYSDQIDHSVLLNFISKKIKDRRFLLLIHHALTCGVMGNRTYHKTYCGTLQRGIISPLLANIYLHQFDMYMENLMDKFGKGRVRSEHSVNWEDRNELALSIEQLKTKQIEASLFNPADKNGQRMKYVRYDDGFVIGIAGSKQSALYIKERITAFLLKELHLTLREENTLITHMDHPISFLGYEFRKRNEIKAKRLTDKNQKHALKKRTLSGAIKLEIPTKKMKEFALKNGYGHLDDFTIVHRSKLMNNSELDILSTYNAELKEIANYYKLANNYHHLDRLFYLAESSFIKTIANKRRSTSKKVATSMRTSKQGVLCLVSRDTKGKEKLYPFIKLKDLPKT
ncbi:reverse transcriptase/maturase family protein [Bacillus weihaiensis]|uniref:RNA-directed DNA polymerase n=1 Tax=Bacillus weihaiensis TaxID=1547283 RepID=A0A1L3MPH4_9BACI|nr:reverse transcriptase/maturase family protein [Bacillus weihaiensis]APH04229.1 RNA-directed DNA polymerase [Bacillus weihaiensis]